MTVRLRRVKALDQRVVSPRVALGYHGDTTAHPRLDEEVLVIVREQVELHTCLFEQRVPREAGVVMCGVQAVLPHAGLSEGLEDICQEEHVCAVVEVVVVSQGVASKGPHTFCA